MLPKVISDEIRLSMLTSLQRLAYFMICLHLSAFGVSSALAAEPAKSTNSPTYQLTGEAEIQSLFVHHGLTQSKNDPALQSAFWFNFGPQFRLGLWGSNVSYDGIDTHLWFRINADINTKFSEKSSLKILYSENRYYSGNSRNGNTIGLHLGFFEYHVIYELNSNWEGTETSSSYFAFQKTYDVLGSWKWDNQLGYTQVKASGYANYFDVRSMIGKQINTYNLRGGVTWSSDSSIGARGGLFFTAALGVRF